MVGLAVEMLGLEVLRVTVEVRGERKLAWVGTNRAITRVCGLSGRTYDGISQRGSNVMEIRRSTPTD